MAVQSTARPIGSRPGIAVALRLVLRLLGLLVFAQAVFAGLFLDGNAAWRQWHAINGMLLIPLLALLAVVLAVVLWRSGGPGWMARAGLGLLLAIIVQNAMGQSGQVAVHVPLGVAILGLVGALLGRTRNLLPQPPPTHPHPAGSCDEDDIDGADAVISTVSAERRKGPNHVAEVSR